MNQCLIDLYVEGIQKGYIVYTDKSMHFSHNVKDNHGLHLFAARVYDAESEAYPKTLLMDDKKTRNLPEFKRAIEIAKSPLGKALT